MRSCSTASRRFRTWRCCGCSRRRVSARTSRRSGSSRSRERAGIAGERIVVHGNNKGDEELRAAAEAGARFVVWTRSTRSSGRPRPASAACSCASRPGIDADTHAAIRTAHHGSKFGLPPDQAREGDRGAAGTRASTSPGCTCTSARSCSTPRRRGRASTGSAPSRPTAAPSSAGCRPWSTSAAGSGSSTSRASGRPRSREFVRDAPRAARPRVGAARPRPPRGDPRARAARSSGTRP